MFSSASGNEAHRRGRPAYFLNDFRRTKPPCQPTLEMTFAGRARTNWPELGLALEVPATRLTLAATILSKNYRLGYPKLYPWYYGKTLV